MKPQVVMKFGGTSVGTPEAMLRTARHIAREERWPIVVVSAVGGVTNMIIRAAEEASQGDSVRELFLQILERHHKIINELELEKGLLSALEEELERLLRGVRMLGELSPRIKDTLLSLGERMSVRLLAATLEKLGLRARAWASWDLGLVTDSRHNKADLLPECHPEIRNRIKDLEPGVIPVVTGFIGRSLAGDITTLGRGGSDFSAAVFGAAAEVEEIQIWTDVPGFMCADPRIVPDAAVIPRMTFEEASELAYFGAKVLHPRTMLPARRMKIPVRVLGTFHIDPDRKESISCFGTLINGRVPRVPLRALAIRSDVHSLHIHSLRMLEAPGFLARVFEILSRREISVDVIATSEVSISMTFDRTEGQLQAAIKEISEFAEVTEVPQRSILCVVGAGLKSDTKILADIFKVLSDSEIPIQVISQGASQINITMVCEPEDAKLAMEVLHNRFFAGIALAA